MKLLLDAHLLLWAAAGSGRLPPLARQLISDTANQRFFSVVSIWEIAIKQSLNRSDFTVDPLRLRQGLIENGYTEIVIEGSHALATLDLPLLHKDPFDRLLIAQATVEGLTLATADSTVARYPGPIIRV